MLKVGYTVITRAAMVLPSKQENTIMSRNEYQANKDLANTTPVVAGTKVVKDAPAHYTTGEVIRDSRFDVEKVGDPNDSTTWELV